MSRGVQNRWPLEKTILLPRPDLALPPQTTYTPVGRRACPPGPASPGRFSNEGVSPGLMLLRLCTFTEQSTAYEPGGGQGHRESLTRHQACQNAAALNLLLFVLTTCRKALPGSPGAEENATTAFVKYGPLVVPEFLYRLGGDPAGAESVVFSPAGVLLDVHP